MKIIARVTVGSQLYGTALPTSDTDLKEIYIPDVKDILLQKADKITRKNDDDDDLDIERIPLHRYIQLLLEGQIFAYDMLFAPDNMVQDTTEDWKELVKMGRRQWISKNVEKMVGYCKAQAYMYGVKAERLKAAQTVQQIIKLMALIDKDKPIGTFPHLINTINALPKEHVSFEDKVHNDGTGRKEKYLKVCGKMISEHDTVSHALKIVENILHKYGKRVKKATSMKCKDWKALMHAVRVAQEALELLETKYITFPRPNADFLLQIKTGKIKFYVIDTIITTTINQIESAMKTTSLPNMPMTGLAEGFAMDVYKREINNAGKESSINIKLTK